MVLSGLRTRKIRSDLIVFKSLLFDALSLNKFALIFIDKQYSVTKKDKQQMIV